MRPMSSQEFRRALHHLFAGDAAANDAGVTSCARLFETNRQTVQRWKKHGPPAATALTLRLMLKFNVSCDQARTLLKSKR